MRVAAPLVLALSLAACAEGPGGAMPDGGVATYDALKQAQARCAAQGGTMTLKSGGDSQYIGDYACKRN
jgi:hypothetical protein